MLLLWPGDDEHEINSTEAKSILDNMSQEFNQKRFPVNEIIITVYINTFVLEREIIAKRELTKTTEV